MQRIYLDNAATTKPSALVIAKMTEVAGKRWGNPSSVHTIGQQAHQVLDEARESVAKFLNCDSTEIVFTSGGSESDNLAIRGLINGKTDLSTNTLKKSFKIDRSDSSKPHIITSATEHHAVLHTIEDLEKQGLIEATYIKPLASGLITREMVEKEIRPNTVLVSLIYVNNETGVIFPIAEIGEMINTMNNERECYPSDPQDHTHIKNHNRIYFHTDAVQAAEFLPMDVNNLGVDLLTFTGHKIHGPRGAGVLYVKKGTPIKPEITGGDQEFRLRAGTENVAAIAGLAYSLGEIKTENTNKVEVLRNKLESAIIAKIPDAIVNGKDAPRSPHILNVSFLNAEGEAIILNLDFLGIAVSSGSACTSRSLDPSHVLSAMGIPPEKAHGSIRFSLSRDTKEEEIDRVIEVLPGIIEKLRAMSPFGN